MLLSINTHIVDKPDNTRGFGKPFDPVDLSADDLITHIQNGHAISAQFMGNRRKSDNFAVAGFLAVDVDQGMTLVEALALPYVQHFASFIYTTASHSDESNRFRIVFELCEPIIDRKAYRAALTGLIYKFGGDESCKDSARMFFGFRGATVHRIAKILPATEVEALIESGTKKRISADGLVAKSSSAIRTSSPFGMDQLVKKADGTTVPLSSITPDDRSIHCPSHYDRHPSAVVVFSKSGSIGIHCAACDKLDWVIDAHEAIDFDWHAQYQWQAEKHFHGWSDEELESASCLAEDGTRIWLYDSRHLPKLSLMPGLTYIRSPKGSGKTEQLAEVVKELKQQGKSILLVGHRRLLLKNLAKRIDIPFYLSKDVHKQIEQTKCLAVSLESLPIHISDPRLIKFDVVILDESEQVVSHFISSTLSHNRPHVRALLEILVLKASHVICADADIGLLTSGYFHLTRGQDHPDNLILNTHRVMHDSMRSLAQPTSQIDLYEDLITLFSDLESDVRNGKRCFIATNSIRQAEVIESNLKQRYPTKSLLLITSKTGDLSNTKAFTSKPRTEALKYDVIICSPALSTGVDISFPNDAREIDSVYGVFKDGITTHFEIDQQLARVRNPGAVRVWISPRRVSMEHDPSAIYEELIRGRDAANFISHYTMDGYPVRSDNNMLELIAWIISIRRASLSNLKEHFVSLKQDNGWKVHTVEEVRHTTWQHKVPTDMLVVAKICDARDPTPSELSWIMAKSSFLGLSPEASFIKRKHDLRQRYSVDDVTPDLVVLDDDGRFEGKFHNLCFLYFHQGDIRLGDLKEQYNKLISSFDWTKGIRKKHLIESLLTAANLYRKGDGFIFDAEVSAESLKEFAAAAIDLKKDLESLLGISVRSDIHKKPIIQLRDVLDSVGMTLTPKKRVMKNRVATDYYRIDLARWKHVVTTVGIEEHLLDRQHLSMQVDIEVIEPAPARLGATSESGLAMHPRDIRPARSKRR